MIAAKRDLRERLSHGKQQPGITAAGVLAKKISDHNSDRFVFWYQN